MVADLSRGASKLFKWKLPPQSTVTIFAQPQLPMWGGKLRPTVGWAAPGPQPQESCRQHPRNSELPHSSGQETGKFWGTDRRKTS